MKTLVITGSTRGIGYGLAMSFLSRGCQVVVSGRLQQSVDEVVAKLGTQFPAECILGQACDIANYKQVQALWDAATIRFGKVDIWLNNAAANSVSRIFGNTKTMSLTLSFRPVLLARCMAARLLYVAC